MRTANGRALVTGGAGFLGSHLCERLLHDGYSVLCVDNYYSSTKDNIAHLLDNPRFEVIRHDVTFPLYVEVDEIYRGFGICQFDQDCHAEERDLPDRRPDRP